MINNQPFVYTLLTTRYDEQKKNIFQSIQTASARYFMIRPFASQFRTDSVCPGHDYDVLGQKSKTPERCGDFHVPQNARVNGPGPNDVSNAFCRKTRNGPSE